MNAKTASRWSLNSTGNRAIYAVPLALLAFWTTGSVALCAVIGVLTFGVLTLFAPRRQATDRQP